MDLFSPAAVELMDEINGTLSAHVATGRVSAVEAVAALKHCSKVRKIALGDALFNAQLDEAMPIHDDDSPPDYDPSYPPN